VSGPRAPAANRWTALWQRFWVLPSTIAAASLLLGITLPLLDQALEGQTPSWMFQGGVDGARSLLSAIAGAMISVTGLVFSITIVTLQLASSQFTPRVLGTFLESRIVQTTLGVFTGSFLYALAVLRAVRGGESVVVPHLSVTASLLYVIAAVAMFLVFIHHVTESIRVTAVMRQVRLSTLRAVHRMTEEGGPPAPGWSPRPGTPWAELWMDERTGYVTVLGADGLASFAAEHDIVVELDVAPGDFLAPDQPIGRVWGAESASGETRDAVAQALRVADERDTYHDTAFGLRQLMDIAERALSPGVNDPTTALQAMNECYVVLRLMAQRRDPSPYVQSEGEVRVVYRPQRYAGILEGVVDELLHHGADSLRTVPRLREVLEDLEAVARPEHRASTRAQLDRVTRSGAQAG
jgi:uncharacterized membrane protein